MMPAMASLVECLPAIINSWQRFHSRGMLRYLSKSELPWVLENCPRPRWNVEREHYYSEFLNTDGRILVALNQDVLVGVCRYEIFEDGLRIEVIVSDGKVSGTGTAILCELAELASVLVVPITVLSSKRATPYYDRIGMRCMNREIDLYGWFPSESKVLAKHLKQARQ